MRQFFSFCLLILIGLVGLCTFVVVYQRADLAPQGLMALGVIDCGGNLCIDGLTPGITDWDTARQVLEHIDAYRHNGDTIFVFDYPTTYVTYWSDPENGLANVEILSKRIYEGLFSTGELVSTSGPPCSIDVTDDGVFIEYPSFVAEISTSYDAIQAGHGKLDPSTPVMRLTFPGSRSPCVEPYTTRALINIPAKWHGFASLEYYVRHRLR